MSMSHIRLYDLFRKELHLPDDKASDFVVAVGEVSVWEADKNRQLLATKNDIHLLKEDIHSLRSELKEDIHSLRSELKEEINSSRLEFKNDIHLLELKVGQFKDDIHKAIYRAGVVQFIAIISAVLAIVKFIR
jgi:hypothetical protein